VPSYNVQLVTDTTHGLVVNVEATTDAIDLSAMLFLMMRRMTFTSARPDSN
jgi:hypothetical protein